MIYKNNQNFEKKVEKISEYLSILENRWDRIPVLTQAIKDIASPYYVDANQLSYNKSVERIDQIAISIVDATIPQEGNKCKTFVIDFQKQQCFVSDTKVIGVGIIGLETNFNQYNPKNKVDIGPQNTDKGYNRDGYRGGSSLWDEREIPSREEIERLERIERMNSYLSWNREFPRTFRSSESSYESNETMDGPKVEPDDFDKI